MRKIKKKKQYPKHNEHPFRPNPPSSASLTDDLHGLTDKSNNGLTDNEFVVQTCSEDFQATSNLVGGLNRSHKY